MAVLGRSHWPHCLLGSGAIFRSLAKPIAPYHVTNPWFLEAQELPRLKAVKDLHMSAERCSKGTGGDRKVAKGEEIKGAPGARGKTSPADNWDLQMVSTRSAELLK